MLKVMIVDDEEHVRGRVSRILSEIPGLETVAQAQDGNSALELFSQHSPNLVVLDINIPGLSGLEVAEELSRRDPDVRMIILSGYQSFDYAQRALKLGICDFLTKPVDPAELKASVQRAVEAFAVLREQRLSHSRLDELLKESLPVLRERFLESMMQADRRRDEQSLRQTAARLGILSGEGRRAVCVVQPQFSQRHLDGAEKNILHIRDIAEQALAAAGLGFERYIDGMYRVVLVAEPGAGPGLRELEQALSSVVGKVRFYLDIPVCCAAGLPVETLSELGESYRCAVEALGCQHLFTQNGVVVYTDVMHMECSDSADCRSEAREVLRSVRVDTPEAVNARLDAFVRRALSCSGGSLRALRRYFLELAAGLMLLGAETGCELDMEDVCRRIFLIDGVLGLSRYSQELCLEVSEAIQRRRSSRSGRLVDSARRYIDGGYTNPSLSLSEVSEQVGLSEKYFCQLFAKEEGVGFTDYVNTRRLSHAKELLASTSLRVYEVAERSGFSNVKYFNVLFKKATGMTPQDYRASLLIAPPPAER